MLYKVLPYDKFNEFSVFQFILSYYYFFFVHIAFREFGNKTLIHVRFGYLQLTLLKIESVIPLKNEFFP